MNGPTKKPVADWGGDGRRQKQGKGLSDSNLTDNTAVVNGLNRAEIEYGFLANFIHNPQSRDAGSAKIKPAFISEPFYRKKYRAALQVIQDGGVLDLETLRIKTADNAVANIGPPVSLNFQFYIDSLLELESRDRRLNAGRDYLKVLENGGNVDAAWGVLQDAQNLTSDYSPKRKTAWTAAEILQHEFPDVTWIVQDIIADGFTIFVGNPKIGKSWFCLGLALAVAQGGYVLGKIAVERRRVLYLALEDTARRLQGRIVKIGAEASSIGLLDIALEWPSGHEGIARLRLWIRENPDVGFIIIDTYARIASPSVDGHEYRGVTAEASGIKAIADETGVPIIAVHHSRKGKAEGDWIDSIMGSQGLAGAADTLLLLRRGRGKREAQLLVTGRDVEERELVVSFDPDTATWILEGTAQEIQVSEARQEILEWLIANGPAGPKDVHEGMKAEGAKRAASTVRRLLGEMVDDGSIHNSGGIYTADTLETHELNEHMNFHEQHERVNSAGVHVHGVHDDSGGTK